MYFVHIVGEVSSRCRQLIRKSISALGRLHPLRQATHKQLGDTDVWTAACNTPAGETAAGDTASVDTVADDTAAGDTSLGDTVACETAAGETDDTARLFKSILYYDHYIWLFFFHLLNSIDLLCLSGIILFWLGRGTIFSFFSSLISSVYRCIGEGQEARIVQIDSVPLMTESNIKEFSQVLLCGSLINFLCRLFYHSSL